MNKKYYSLAGIAAVILLVLFSSSTQSTSHLPTARHFINLADLFASRSPGPRSTNPRLLKQTKQARLVPSVPVGTPLGRIIRHSQVGVPSLVTNILVPDRVWPDGIAQTETINPFLGSGFSDFTPGFTGGVILASSPSFGGGGIVGGGFPTPGNPSPPLVVSPTPPTAAVPEPSVWFMMLLGFFMLGGLMRRKQHRKELSYE